MQRFQSPAPQPSIEFDSSPDPLALSTNSHNSNRRDGRAMSRLTSPRKTPLREISANSQLPPQSPPTHAKLPSNSPMKAITEQTLSPWKIRVTVEAEPEDGEGGAQMTTRTYQVPLKPCSSPLEAHASRGRAKKPAQSSPARKKRSGTPVRGARKSLTDLTITVLGDDEDADEWSPRKNAASKRRTRQSSPVKQKRRAEPPRDVEESDDMYGAHDTRPDSEEPTEELRTIDLNQVSVRNRAASVRQKESSPRGNPPPPATHTHSVPKQSRNFSNHSTRSYPTPSPTPSAPVDEPEDDGPLPDDAAEGDFDTILESEGFTMIDLDTIASAKRDFSSPDGLAPAGQNDIQEHPEHADKAGVASDVEDKEVSSSRSTKSQQQCRPAEDLADETELSSNVASSPPIRTTYLELPNRVGIVRRVTPDIYSSPKLPSPPRHSRRDSSPPSNVVPPRRVVNAGRALLGALSSPGSVSSDQRHLTPSSGQENFLEGFSSGTKRELRAGLRFGEELAKRQSPVTISESKTLPTQPEVNRKHDTQIWRGERVVQHSPFATDVSAQTKEKAGHDQTTHQQSRKLPLFQEQNLQEEVVQDTATPEAQKSDQALRIEYPTLERRQIEREHEWQLEREAVSRQINEASPSKVIVIDSSSIEIDTPQQSGRRPGRAHNTHAEAARAQEGRGMADVEARHHHEGADQGRPKEDEVRSEGVAVQKSGRTGSGFFDSARPSSDDPRERNSVGEVSAGEEDEEVREEDQTDLWLEQAQLSSSSPQQDNHTHKDAQLPPKHQHDAEKPATKPKRSIIPSPWKRGENIEESTVFTNGDASGMLWQEPIGCKFGATELARQSRKPRSDGFDVSRMLLSPAKLAFSGRRNMKLRNPGEESSSLEQSSSVEDTMVTDSHIDESTNQMPMNSSPPLAVKIPVNFNESSMVVEDSRPPSATTTTTCSSSSEGTETSTRRKLCPSAAASQEKTSRRPSPPNITIPAKDDVKANTFNGETPLFTGPKSDRTSSPHDRATVRFAEPSSAGGMLTPPSTMVSNDSDDGARPPTPRSAMKGGRVSAGLEEPGVSPTKRVIFNERSRYLNEHGDESTMSANLDSPAPVPVIEVQEPDEDEQRSVQGPVTEAVAENKSSSWFSWFMRGKTSPSTESQRVEQKQTSRSAQVKVDHDPSSAVGRPKPPSPSESSSPPSKDRTRSTKDESPSIIMKLPATKSHQPSTTSTSLAQPQPKSKSITTTTTKKPPSNPTATSSRILPPKPPSYLLPPSYPTIPHRLTTEPLSTTGPFTNTHFRTLHLLHAKSRYHSFHIPKHIRSGIANLRGMKLTIDETSWGSDEFEWEVGFVECAVLERFVREVEWDCVLARSGGAGVQDVVAQLQRKAVEVAIRRETAKASTGDVGEAERWLADISGKKEIKAYWESLAEQGRDVFTRELRGVEWGWSYEQLAVWLGRIVVGEVVREEEKRVLGEKGA